MALINCPDCGRSVSERATACPSCGYPIASMGHSSVSSPPVSGRTVAPRVDDSRSLWLLWGSVASFILGVAFLTGPYWNPGADASSKVLGPVGGLTLMGLVVVNWSVTGGFRNRRMGSRFWYGLV